MNASIRFMLLLTLVALGAQNSHAARLVGTVTVPWNVTTKHEDTSISAYSGRLGSVRERQPSDHGNGVQDVVLSLIVPEALPDSAPTRARASTPEETPQLVQVGQRFQPHVLGVPLGTTVAFPNVDPVFHNVFSYSKAKRFDLGKYGQGKSKSVTFDQPGIVKVFCEIHSDMTAFIVVADTPWVTQPDGEGKFAFEGLESGVYELHSWHPKLGAAARTVHIDGSDTSVRINL